MATDKYMYRTLRGLGVAKGHAVAIAGGGEYADRIGAGGGGAAVELEYYTNDVWQFGAGMIAAGDPYTALVQDGECLSADGDTLVFERPALYSVRLTWFVQHGGVSEGPDTVGIDFSASSQQLSLDYVYPDTDPVIAVTRDLIVAVAQGTELSLSEVATGLDETDTAGLLVQAQVLIGDPSWTEPEQAS